MRCYLRVDNKFLSHLLFGNDEIEIVDVDEVHHDGVSTVFMCDANPDSIEHKEGAWLVVEFKTEMRIIDRKIKVLP